MSESEKKLEILYKKHYDTSVKCRAEMIPISYKLTLLKKIKTDKEFKKWLLKELKSN